MPYTVERRDGKFRVVLAANGRIATNSEGTALDGGGHSTREEAERQARAIEWSENRGKGFYGVENEN